MLYIAHEHSYQHGTFNAPGLAPHFIAKHSQLMGLLEGRPVFFFEAPARGRPIGIGRPVPVQ